jgi:hypothetical protein
MQIMIMKNDEWKIDCNRFVGFMDVMGFKDMIARKSHEEVGEALLRFFVMLLK